MTKQLLTSASLFMVLTVLPLAAQAPATAPAEEKQLLALGEGSASPAKADHRQPDENREQAHGSDRSHSGCSHLLKPEWQMRTLRLCILLISVGCGFASPRAARAVTRADCRSGSVSRPARPALRRQLTTTQTAGSLQAAVQALEQIKAANQETLKRQQTVLEQLDELQKAAEQIKIYTKRG